MSAGIWKLGAPPVVAMATLAGVIAWNATTNARPTASPEYLSRVHDEVLAIPYAVGPLVGTDLEVIPAAARMLRPNVIFQRTYRDPFNGNSLDLVIIHCEDVRDLEGHYPPVCYPNAGWDVTDAAREVSLAAEEVKVRARRYSFAKRTGLTEHAVNVVSFFVLPTSEETAPDMVEVQRTARSPKAAGLGAMHVMIVSPSGQPEDVTERLTDDVLRTLRPVLRAMESRQLEESRS